MALLQALYNPIFRGTDGDNNPLPGGLLYTYVAGTSTPLATYADAEGTTPNANPVILDENGEALIFLGSDIYKFVLQDQNNVPIWTADQISSIRVTDASSITGVLSLDQLPDYPLSRLVIDQNTGVKFFYQTVALDGTPFPQRGLLRFTTPFDVENDGAGATNVSYGSVASAGTYNNANITVDEWGRVTAAASNPYVFPSRVDDANGSSLTFPDGTIMKWGTSAAAPTGVPKGSVSVTFPAGAFTVTPSVTCTPDNNPDGSLDPIEVHATNITVNGFIANFTCPVLIGGSGASNITNTVHACWEAKGH